MLILKIERMGGVPRIKLPVEMTDRLGVTVGQKIIAIETARGYLLPILTDEQRSQVEIGGDFMERYAETFRKLKDR